MIAAKEAAERARNAIAALPDGQVAVCRIRAAPIGEHRREADGNWGIKAICQIDAGSAERWLAKDLPKVVATTAAALLDIQAEQGITIEQALEGGWRDVRATRRAEAAAEDSPSR